MNVNIDVIVVSVHSVVMTEDTEEDELLPTGRVAARLGVHRGTIHAWILAGRLPAVRTPGGHYRIRESTVAHEERLAECYGARKASS